MMDKSPPATFLDAWTNWIKGRVMVLARLMPTRMISNMAVATNRKMRQRQSVDGFDQRIFAQGNPQGAKLVVTAHFPGTQDLGKGNVDHVQLAYGAVGILLSDGLLDGARCEVVRIRQGAVDNLAVWIIKADLSEGFVVNINRHNRQGLGYQMTPASLF